MRRCHRPTGRPKGKLLVKSWRNWIASRRKTVPMQPADDAREQTTERGWPLRISLLFWVTIALTPIAIVSILQGIDRARVDVADVHERLVQSAHAAAADEENLLSSAEQIARALSNISDVRRVTPNCDSVLGDA